MRLKELLAYYEAKLDAFYADKAKLEQLEEQRRVLQEALVWLQEVREKRVAWILSTLENTVTLALRAVFGPSYEFKYDKGEGFVLLIDGEKRTFKEVGGGVCDIVSFALRVGMLVLRAQARILILDEPFRFLSRDLRPKVRDLLQVLCNTLGIQFIIVTHDPAIVPESAHVIKIGSTENSYVVEGVLESEEES